MAKGSGGGGRSGGRFRGTERQAARALRFPGGQYLTGRGQRVVRRLNSLQDEINRTGNAISAASAQSFAGNRYKASYRKQQAAQRAKLERRMATLQRRRQVLQRGVFGTTA